MIDLNILPLSCEDNHSHACDARTTTLIDVQQQSKSIYLRHCLAQISTYFSVTKRIMSNADRWIPDPEFVIWAIISPELLRHELTPREYPAF